MVATLSRDLRVRVIEAVKRGASRREAAARFEISVATAVRWVKAWEETGRDAPHPRGGDRRSKRVEAEAAFLLDLIARKPDLTLEEIRERLARDRDLTVSVSSVSRFFKRHGVTYKKSRHTPRSRSGRT